MLIINPLTIVNASIYTPVCTYTYSVGVEFMLSQSFHISNLSYNNFLNICNHLKVQIVSQNNQTNKPFMNILKVTWLRSGVVVKLVLPRWQKAVRGRGAWCGQPRVFAHLKFLNFDFFYLWCKKQSVTGIKTEGYSQFIYSFILG